MSDYDSSALDVDVLRLKSHQKKRSKERYDLARELGFSSLEARVLMAKSESIIRQIAKEREKKAGGT